MRFYCLHYSSGFSERFGSRYDAGDLRVQEDIINFAAGKLLNNEEPSTSKLELHQQLACLSQRLPIEFNSTTYTSQKDERNQVEGHLRVCLKIDESFGSMVTVSASEPLLSEGAYFMMQKPSFDAPKVMKSVLEGFSVHKGDRGELLGLLLLTLARDDAVGPADENGRPLKGRCIDVASYIYGSLLRKPLADTDSASTLKRLKRDFPNAKLHFNHFVKLHDYSSVGKESLLYLASRGAGVLCANNHAGIDAVNTFLLSDNSLVVKNLGVILEQFKNDSKYNSNPVPELFERMDCYQIGILKPGDPPIPSIRIVFALASQTPALSVIRHPPSSTYEAVTYDIWCAGLSPIILKPIEDTQAGVWNSLLQASYSWKAIYKTEVPLSMPLRQSMNPGAAIDAGHWARFTGTLPTT
jgi:hypothetical protein